MAGKHRRNVLCNKCGKGEGDQGQDGRLVTLLIDLERYEPRDMVFQKKGTPPPLSLIWCTECAIQMVLAGDPIEHFREFGYPDNSPDGPYAQFLRHRGRGIHLVRPPDA